MGYYSEVGLTISAAGYKQLDWKTDNAGRFGTAHSCRKPVGACGYPLHEQRRRSALVLELDQVVQYVSRDQLAASTAQRTRCPGLLLSFGLERNSMNVETDGSWCENPFEMEVSRGISMREAIEA